VENVGIWVAIAGTILAGIIQVVVFAFFLGSLAEKVRQLEGRPNNDTKLGEVSATVNNLKEAFIRFEASIDDKFKELDHTVRNVISGRYARGNDTK
jgi:L-cystine uptake protein TcyP (sodium:dicarboxylate symporter family)